MEPIFAASYDRTILDEEGKPRHFALTDYALTLWRAAAGVSEGVPEDFVTAADLAAEAHLDMQAALQPFVDNAISKTINVPAGCSFEDFKRIYDLAYDRGLKGCTTFLPNPVTGAVLTEIGSGIDAPHCCAPDREAD